MNEIQKMINRTSGNKQNNPINNYSRIIIEKEKNSEPIAVITNENVEVAKGFRVRLKPVYSN